MEGYLRIGLLIIAAVIFVLMMFEARSRRRPHSEFHAEIPSHPPEESDFTIEAETQSDIALKPSELSDVAPYDLLVISVIAKSGQSFESYDLLQAISSAGLQYGDKKIFHYQVTTDTEKLTLFSLASATEPGYFDLDNIGSISCFGLTLFMNIRTVPDPSYAFELMYKTAEQLADDLGGELRAGQKMQWNDQVLNQYREQVLQYVE